VVLALVAIGLATLVPDRGPGAEPSFGCIICGERGFADAIANVVLFVPLGVGLALLGTSLRRGLLLGALASGLIEFIQLMAMSGRDPSIGDVLFNTLGTWSGSGLVPVVPILARLDDQTAARLSVAAALDVVLAVTVTAWLLQPSFPRTAYWGQWTPNLGHLEWYRGRVHDARIAGMTVRSRRIEDSGFARAALLRGGPVEVEFTAGRPVTGLASLFSVYDENQQEILLIGPDRDDLVLRYRMRAAAWRLDQPDLRLRDGMRGVRAGRETAVRAWSPARGEYCLRIDAQTGCGLGPTIGSGWGLLYYPESIPPWLKRLLGAGWVALMVAPTGLLLRARRESILGCALTLAGIGVLPPLLGLRPSSLREWCGAALAVGGGAAVARWTRKRQMRERAEA